MVDFHASDCWDRVPEAKYDLVVGNMPYRNNETCEWEERSENWQDLNWDIHRRFFAGVTPRLNKNAIVVLVENGAFSSVNDFMNMAEDSGLLMIDSYPDQLHDKYYYLESSFGLPDRRYTQHIGEQHRRKKQNSPNVVTTNANQSSRYRNKNRKLVHSDCDICWRHWLPLLGANCNEIEIRSIVS